MPGNAARCIRWRFQFTIAPFASSPCVRRPFASAGPIFHTAELRFTLRKIGRLFAVRMIPFFKTTFHIAKRVIQAIENKGIKDSGKSYIRQKISERIHL
jgi:hypothetical protein